MNIYETLGITFVFIMKNRDEIICIFALRFNNELK
jgi:hypothetical protein